MHQVTKMVMRAAKRVQGERQVTSRTSNDQNSVKRPFSCQEGEVEDGAQQSSCGADQSSLESAECSFVARALISRESG